MNTIDSGISQLHSYDNAIGNYQKPMVSQPSNDESSLIRIHAPEIKKNCSLVVSVILFFRTNVIHVSSII